METNKSHVKYEANVSELACKELNLALLSANLKAYLLTIQVAQLSQRDRAAGWVSNGQK